MGGFTPNPTGYATDWHNNNWSDFVAVMEPINGDHRLIVNKVRQICQIWAICTEVYYY